MRSKYQCLKRDQQIMLFKIIFENDRFPLPTTSVIFARINAKLVSRVIFQSSNLKPMTCIVRIVTCEVDVSYSFPVKNVIYFAVEILIAYFENFTKYRSSSTT